MKRRLFNLLAAVSLVICIASAVLWIRSYYVVDKAGVARARVYWIESNSAALRLGVEDNFTVPFEKRDYKDAAIEGSWTAYRKDWSLFAAHGVPYVDSSQRRFFGFACVMSEYSMHLSDTLVVRSHEVWIPYWFFTALSAIVPVLVLRRALQRGPIASHACVECGYDLRASKERCPECGTAIPAASVEAK